MGLIFLQIPGLVYWYQDSEILRNGPDVSINTTFMDDGIISELIILKVTEKHSGNFTCWPTKFPPDSVLVHVVPGKRLTSTNGATWVRARSSGFKDEHYIIGLLAYPTKGN